MTKNASNGRMKLVSQTEIITTKGGGPNGRFQFSTYKVEMPVSYCIYTKISQESIVWACKGRCTGDFENAVLVQEGGDYRRSCMRRSCALVREHSAKAVRMRFYGIPQRKISIDGFR